MEDKNKKDKNQDKVPQSPTDPGADRDEHYDIDGVSFSKKGVTVSSDDLPPMKPPVKTCEEIKGGKCRK